jgi:FkbM family methyltransferase
MRRQFFIQMKCVIITPVGPGHETVSKECQTTVERAWQTDRGAFSNFEHILIDDTRGLIGRSEARNQAVRRAIELRADWLFFLDADDGMLPTAFGAVAPHLENYDAIWGNIWEMPFGKTTLQPRLPQILTIESYAELLVHDPFLTLQMGHFVRAALAAQHPFDTAMNTGEDFHYYLRVWAAGRCVKIRAPFFVNRRGYHSVGPRSADGIQWNQTVHSILGHARMAAGIPEEEETNLRNTKTLQYREWIQAQRLPANRIPHSALSRALPYRGGWTVNCFECPSFQMHTDNDDLMLSQIFWTGTFEQGAMRVWLRLARTADLLLDVGAYTGVYGLAAASINSTAKVFCIESLHENWTRIEKNLHLNGFPNLNSIHAAVTPVEGPVMVDVFGEGSFLQSSTSSISHNGRKLGQQQRVPGARLARILEELLKTSKASKILVKIDVERLNADLFGGLEDLLKNVSPDFLLRAFSVEDEASMTAFFSTHGYFIYRIKEEPFALEQKPQLIGEGMQQRLCCLVTRKTLEALRSEFGF